MDVVADSTHAPDAARPRRRGRPTPTGQERSFGEDELIVSKTDLRGVITYANDVFLRVSAYPASQIVGSPHNLIRHPHMPRGLFRLLWESIGAGQEIFAYIDNLAADGSNYWVLAHVTPNYDQSGTMVGFHSNRRKPERGPIERITPLYRRMCQLEQQHSSAVTAAQASAAMLREELTEKDLSYDEFVWALITDDASVTR